MIGLEYILSLYGMQRQELVKQLKIKQPNFNLWISGKQNVSSFNRVLSNFPQVIAHYQYKDLYLSSCLVTN
ncbi:hypothetical protein [Clostridium uliginosum]|uniref:Uncharacterized protein n=1 Tax=Clostridium uliginosum TaxID=119641 RepID=A0A1I1PD19_9CLOT|nr:hypothetical protein [Clostridium uliginosum]SFD05528.1 hypothetical protein SAMN05421842_11827 [Clostridium uliginosum]